MTNVSRPIHLQLRPASSNVSLSSTCPPPTPLGFAAANPNGAADSMPSQILPHLFVGNQEQTNRDTVNRLEISYILSLGLLPLISNSMQPQHSSPSTTPAAATTEGDSSSSNPDTSATTKPSSSTNNNTTCQDQNGAHHHHHHHIVMPSQNSSKDYKIRLKSNNINNNNNNNSNQDLSSTTSRKLSDCDENNKQGNSVKTAVRYIQCKCINIADSSEQTNLTKFFDEAHQFIDEARRKKCNILVHCLAGISRSPTIAIAYLMRVNSLRLQDAYNLVKQCRPQIDVNLSFMGQLMIYGKRLLTSCRRPIPRQPADSNNLAINNTIPCDKNHVNNNQQSADSEANIVEERNCECDLSHIVFICKQ